MAKPTKDNAKTYGDLYKAFADENDSRLVVDYIPSGSIIWDSLLGGGLPRRKLIELTSEPGVGKTLIALALSASVIMSTKDEIVLYNDVEQAVDDPLLGVISGGVLLAEKGKRFHPYRKLTYEEVEELYLAYMGLGKLALVVYDSITALVPKVVLTNPVGTTRPGLKASFESDFIVRQKYFASHNNFTALYVNQLRTKFGKSFQTWTEGSGGFAVRYYSDVRFRARNIEQVKNKEGMPIAAEIEVLSVKNKLVGNVKANMFVTYGKGVNNIASYIAYLAKLGFMMQSGSFFAMSIPGLPPENVRGHVGAEQYVRDNLAAVEQCLRKSTILAAIPDSEVNALVTQEAAEEKAYREAVDSGAILAPVPPLAAVESLQGGVPPPRLPVNPLVSSSP